jgi:hypothetical protein
VIGKDTWNDVSLIKFVKPNVPYYVVNLEKTLFVLEKYIYSAFLGLNVLHVTLSILGLCCHRLKANEKNQVFLRTFSREFYQLSFPLQTCRRIYILIY